VSKPQRITRWFPHFPHHDRTPLTLSSSPPFPLQRVVTSKGGDSGRTERERGNLCTEIKIAGFPQFDYPQPCSFIALKSLMFHGSRRVSTCINERQPLDIDTKSSFFLKKTHSDIELGQQWLFSTTPRSSRTYRTTGDSLTRRYMCIYMYRRYICIYMYRSIAVITTWCELDTFLISIVVQIKLLAELVGKRYCAFLVA